MRTATGGCGANRYGTMHWTMHPAESPRCSCTQSYLTTQHSRSVCPNIILTRSHVLRIPFSYRAVTCIIQLYTDHSTASTVCIRSTQQDEVDSCYNFICVNSEGRRRTATSKHATKASHSQSQSKHIVACT